MAKWKKRVDLKVRKIPQQKKENPEEKNQRIGTQGTGDKKKTKGTIGS